MCELVIVAKDRIGLLAEISYVLGKNEINIESINLNVVDGRAIVRLEVKQKELAMKLLRNAGFEVYTSMHSVFILPNKPGELHRLTEKYANQNKLITSISILAANKDRTVVSIKT